MGEAIMPTVGRVVYYKSRGSADGKFPSVDRAAVITDVRDVGSKDGVSAVPFPEDGLPTIRQVRLAVLNPEGLFFSDWLYQGSEGGQWDWMPFQKDQQARLAK